MPSIASNLASVHKICHDNQCWCYFDENIISIQALAMGNVLYQGKSEDSVYPIYPQKASQLSLSSNPCNSAFHVSVFNKTLWHLRLGHPSDQVLKHLFPNAKIDLNKYTFVNNDCTHYLYGKIHNLPFPKSSFTASTPFELIHSDLWGPAPITSINGFKYYVFFIDHFTIFTWIYLLKSNLADIFTKLLPTPPFIFFRSKLLVDSSPCLLRGNVEDEAQATQGKCLGSTQVQQQMHRLRL